MPSTFTSRLGLELQATGENSGTWGSNLNSNAIQLIDTAIAGLTSVALAASDVTLTKQNGTADQSRSAILYLHGTLAANVAVVVPSVTKTYTVDNKTTGNFSVTIKTAGGSGVVIPQNRAQNLYVTGASVIPSSQAVSADVSIPTFGTAAFLNAGTSVNELPPVSVADARYVLNYGVSAIAYAATVTVDFALARNFTVSLGGNTTLVPINMNPQREQAGVIWLYQPTAGGANVTWPSNFKFPSGASVSLTPTSSAVDLVPYVVRTSTIIDVAALRNMR